MLNGICALHVICLLFGTVLCQLPNSLDFDNLQKQFQQNSDLGDLEKRLQESGVNLSDLNNTKVDPTKIENVLKEKCDKQNASDAVDNLKAQSDVTNNCVSLQINATEVQKELDEAKKTGSMDEVFAKYCRRWPDIYNCYEGTIATVRRCLSTKEETAFNKTLEIGQEFQEFMCHKDGDRLAMFVAEGGVECVQEQQEGIKQCLNSTVGARLPAANDLSVATLPTFLFAEKDCQDFDTLRLCINEVLENCKDSTPANIIDASLKFLKKQMPCGSSANDETVPAPAEKAVLTTNSAYGLWSSIFVVFGCLLFLNSYFLS